MAKVLAWGLLFCLVSGFAFAQEMNDAIPMNGMIVDVQSANSNMDNLAEFLKNYTKNDALSPEALAAGYGIFLDDGYMQFDKESNLKISEFLNKPESKLEVTVIVNIGEDDILSLASIQKQE